MKMTLMKNANAYDLWRDIENAFLSEYYKGRHIFCKHIIKKQLKKDGTTEHKSYIYYYQVGRRDEDETEMRKEYGMNNKYTKHEYLGSFKRFKDDYVSFMDELFEEGYIKEHAKGVFEIRQDLIKKLEDEAPKSLLSEEVQEVKKQLEELK